MKLENESNFINRRDTDIVLVKTEKRQKRQITQTVHLLLTYINI